MFPIDRPPALVYTMDVKREGGIVMYLMYDDEGNFMGVLNEHLGHNLLMNNRDFLFVKFLNLSILMKMKMNGKCLLTSKLFSD